MNSKRGKIKVFFVLYFGDHISSQSLQSCIMKFRCIFREDCTKLFWETTYKVNHGRHYPRIVAHRSILARTWFQGSDKCFLKHKRAGAPCGIGNTLANTIDNLNHPIALMLFGGLQNSQYCKVYIPFSPKLHFLLKREFYNAALFTPGSP